MDRVLKNPTKNLRPVASAKDGMITLRQMGITDISTVKKALKQGYESGKENMSDYPRVSRIQTGKTQMEFIAYINAPAGGTLYIRAYAIVDEAEVYSPEYQIRIK